MNHEHLIMPSTLPSIALLDDYHSRANNYADFAQQSFATFEFFDKPFANEDEVVSALQHIKAVGLMRERTPFPRSLIERLPNLELIVTSGKKNASIVWPLPPNTALQFAVQNLLGTQPRN